MVHQRLFALIRVHAMLLQPDDYHQQLSLSAWHSVDGNFNCYRLALHWIPLGTAPNDLHPRASSARDGASTIEPLSGCLVFKYQHTLQSIEEREENSKLKVRQAAGAGCSV